MSVDGNISDLFFNLDHDHCKKHDNHGNLVEFDADSLNTSAVWFLKCLHNLGVAGIPTTQELVNDFYARV